MVHRNAAAASRNAAKAYARSSRGTRTPTRTQRPARAAVQAASTQASHRASHRRPARRVSAGVQRQPAVSSRPLAPSGPRRRSEGANAPPGIETDPFVLITRLSAYVEGGLNRVAALGASRARKSTLLFLLQSYMLKQVFGASNIVRSQNQENTTRLNGLERGLQGIADILAKGQTDTTALRGGLDALAKSITSQNDEAKRRDAALVDRISALESARAADAAASKQSKAHIESTESKTILQHEATQRLGEELTALVPRLERVEASADKASASASHHSDNIASLAEKLKTVKDGLSTQKQASERLAIEQNSVRAEIKFAMESMKKHTEVAQRRDAQLREKNAKLEAMFQSIQASSQSRARSTTPDAQPHALFQQRLDTLQRAIKDLSERVEQGEEKHSREQKVTSDIYFYFFGIMGRVTLTSMTTALARPSIVPDSVRAKCAPNHICP